LGLQSSVLDIIEADYPHDQRKRLSKTLDAWIKQDQDKATWGVLELAITNANRVELALSPLPDLNTSKNTISIRKFYPACCYPKQAWFSKPISQYDRLLKEHFFFSN